MRPPPPPPPSRPLLPPRAQRASGREASGRTRTDGLLRGAERFDQGKQHRRRAGAVRRPTSSRTVAESAGRKGGTDGGREGAITLIQPTIK